MLNPRSCAAFTLPAVGQFGRRLDTKGDLTASGKICKGRSLNDDNLKKPTLE